MTRKPSNSELFGAAAIGGGLLAYSALIEPFAIEHVEITLKCSRLPVEFDGYRVLLLSDFHSRRIGRREKQVLKAVKKMTPHDLIVLDGDLTHTHRGMQGMATFVSQLSARDKIVATYGNSEYKNGVVPHQFARMLTDAGAEVLLNRNIRLNRGQSNICIAGVDDPVSRHDDIDSALLDVPTDLFTILLMHSPDSVGQAVARGVDVILSGHTHGGQVKFPIIGAPYTHSILGPKMNSGLYNGKRLMNILGYSPGRSQLYVSRGVGVSGLALRFLCRPEITTITLRRQAS